MSQRTIMHIDLDAFFVSVEQVLNPNLKGKPVVVGGKADQRGVVATASYEARVYGLHSGMPLITASRLCPQAIFVEGNYLKYREVSKKFMAILSGFSPFIEPGGLDEAFLDVTGFESLHGSIFQMATSIKNRITKELGLNASIGIAACKIVAKVASDESKPDGLLEIPPGQEASFFEPMPIRKLPGIGPKTETVLKKMGISTLGELACAPEEVLKSRFGVYGKMLHCHARGEDTRSVSARGEAGSISREVTFSKDTNDKALMSAELRYLSEKVGADLRNHRIQAKCITIKLRYSDFTTITRSLTLARGTDSDQIIFENGDNLMRKELGSGRRAIRLIGICASGLNEPGNQLALLDSSGQRLEILNRVVDRIRLKYGFSSIQTGRTLWLKDMFQGNKPGSDNKRK
jgi:DNA polymerase-4